MGSSGLHIKEIRLLHLTRNAPSLLMALEAQPDTELETQARFSMFDYFDWLDVTKGEALDHMACLGLDTNATEAAVPSVSSQYLTLVTLEGEQESSEVHQGWGLGDPFFSKPDQADLFRELPFLSVMMVTILPDPRQEPAPSGKVFPPHTKLEDIDGFLKSCAEELRAIVWETCQDTYKTSSGLQAVFQVYHCINSGNFCIVLRSRTPELTYHISMRVRAATLNQERNYNFPILDCSTFSLLGVAYRTGPDGAVAGPPNEVTSASTSKVALRLSVTNQVRNNLFQHAPHSVIEELSGLYGRYDVTLRLDLMQFWQIYPWICAHKLGQCPAQATELAEHESDVVTLLQGAMADQGAQCINARLLVHVDGDAPENSGARRKKRQEKVRQENRKIAERIKQVLQLTENLPYCQEDCQKYLYLLWDLWESYSSLRYQDDSFINGNMLLAQMSLLLRIISCYIKSINLDTANESDYQTLVVCLKRAINSISHFQKMMLSINQQSLQAPNYEVQMHTDMEKFVVAYTEFSRRFLSEHFLAKPYRDEMDALKKHRQLIFPMITVDMVHKAIQATPLFLLPYQTVLDRDLLDSNRQQERILLSIEVPDTEAFGNLYATLPLICHELSHNFRIMDRDERNDTLEYFILHKVAQYVVRQWISDTSENSTYTAFGVMENRLYVDKLTEQLDLAYRKRCGEIHSTANIGALNSNILLFLAQDVFTLRDQHILQRSTQSPGQIKNQLKQLYNIAYDAMDGETPEWIQDYQSCCDFLDQLEKKRLQVEQSGTNLIEEENQDLAQLSNQLNHLTKRMVTDIFTWHMERILDVGISFADQVEELQTNFKSSKTPSYFDVLMNALENIINPDEAIKNIFLTPDRTDQWISKLYAQRTAIIKHFQPFKNQLRQCSVSEAQIRAVSLSERALDYTICGLCHAVKDSNHLILLLNSCQQYKNRLYQGTCDHLLKHYHDSIRMELEYYYENRENSDWILHSAPQIQELTAPLSSDLEQTDLFFQSLKRVFSNITRKHLLSLVNDSTTLYREVFADLGMCVCLHLNTFGYLRVLSRNDIFCEGCRDNGLANMRLERMCLVSQLLMENMSGNAEKNLERLKEDLESCFKESTAVVEQAMSLEGQADEKWRMLRGRMELLVHHQVRANGIPAFTVTRKDLESWLDTEGKDSQFVQKQQLELYLQLRSLWNLVHLTNCLIETLTIQADHTLKKHFTKLLAMFQTQWDQEAEHLPGSDVLDLVGDAYNNPQRMSIPKRSQQMFRVTLSFVLYYYYHSWNVYGQSFQKEDGLEAWLEALMGGGAS